MKCSRFKSAKFWFKLNDFQTQNIKKEFIVIPSIFIGLCRTSICKQIISLAIFLPAFSINITNAKIIPIEDFTKPEASRMVKLSPDGKYIALVFDNEGKDFLAIIDSKTKKPLKSFGVRGRRKAVDKIYWVNNDRLIYSPSKAYFRDRGKRGNTELYGVNVDGTEHKRLFGYFVGKRKSHDRKTNSEKGNFALIDMLKHDFKHILIAFFPWKNLKNGWLGNDFEANTLVYKLNIYNGRTTLVEELPLPNSETLTDNGSVIRFVYGSNKEGIYQSMYREHKNSDWVVFDPPEFRDSEMYPIAFTDKNENIYITAVVEGGTRGLFLFNLEKQTSRKIFHDKSVNIKRLISNFKKNRYVAVSTEETYPKYHYLDINDKKSKLHRKLIKMFSGRNVVFGSRTKDGKYITISTYSDRIPLEHFLVEVDNIKNISRIVDTLPWIKHDQMGFTEAMIFKVRDGSTINGYVTFPNIEQTDNLPLVVLPHGGPHGVRDYWKFDPEVQLLASRGYAVLQVNFRGSGGYGMYFSDAGYRKWGTLMQEDIIDATKQLISKKIVDPSRICIYGGSFGGYSALMSSIIEPKLFKCAIGFAGVYDLNLMYKTGDIWERASGLVYLQDVLGQDEAKLREQSPTHNIEKIETNLLLIHGKKDKRVPIEHAFGLMKALDYYNKKYEWLELENEGHGYADPKNRLNYYKRVLSFLNKNIGNKRELKRTK